MNRAGAKYEYVDDQTRFAELCEVWRELPAIGLDTEFVRTRTFYPRAGLLQFGVESDCFLVDPLAISDWEPCRRLLARTQVIMHAAGEDLGLLYHLLGVAPADLFDTQLAAAFLGVGFSLGYRDLVSRFCAVELRKSETRSNWRQRPLSPWQLRYAADDVRFLSGLRQRLDADLRAKNARGWFAEECRRLRARAAQDEDPQTWLSGYLQVDECNSLNERGRSLLQQLCYWREREIRARDLPRNWLAADRELAALARHLANRATVDADAIRAAVGVNPKFARKFAAELAAFLRRAPSASMPPRRSREFAALDLEQRRKLKQCRGLVADEAARAGVCRELLCTGKQLRRIVHSHAATGRIDWPPEMRGWRRGILAPALAGLMPEASASGAG